MICVTTSKGQLHSMGRKSTFNAKDAAEIVARLGKGEPLTIICRDEWLPTDRTIRNWMDESDEFASAIAHAREVGFDVIAAQCLTIADAPNATVNPDTKEPELRDPARDRLRVETRLKLLAKWDPKRYGDKQQVEHSGQVGVYDWLLSAD